MTAIAKQQTGGLIQWLRLRLNAGRQRTQTWGDAGLQSAQAALALQLAACEDDQQLAALLPTLQQRLQHLFWDCDQADLYLLLPAATQQPLQVFSSPTLQPTAGLQRLLRQQAALAATQHSADCPLHLCRAADATGELMLMAIGGATQGWLAVHFRGLHPGAERVRQRCAGLRSTLAQGLAIRQQRLLAVQQALSEERTAQASELHDTLAQVLGYLRIRSARLQALTLGCDNDALQACADDVATQTLLAYRQVRELIASSRLQLAAGTLDDSLQQAVQEFEQHSAIVFEVDNRCPGLHTDAEQRLQLIYIVREALTNIVRHAHASHARIRLSLRDNRLRVRVEDNGRGIRAGEGRNDSFGLKIMQERAQRIGARLAIAPRPGGGTCVDISLAVKA